MRLPALRIGVAILAISVLSPPPARAATVVGATTTVSWVTFIPQAKIDAPKVGCDYGDGFQFGGDNRTGWDWRNGRYRTSLNVVINWSQHTADAYSAIGTSHVYRKSTGRLVATKTASNAGMEAYALGWGSDYVALRLVTHATNPFCHGLFTVKGAIDGALQLWLYKDGRWVIHSGTYRRMPNHYIYIYIYKSGRVSNVLTSPYRSAGCLIGSAYCDTADLTGYSGTFH